ncbi:NAD+ synthase [Mucilaginibacter phyllosphaerae]|uniref:Glutamine-dependent NAD(+) synthetase n=1 Tax=Mucilaginibacter phyllosphaerae TaxID=1812349 RepID=A0A4Y8AGN7_9SPHI|nr:NAD+ synthase [Mucilaginibacter phyllosphaerae]MBB3968454.1 NAD+ synthase (glutamine-hydrolyzing) [Mucilaginibacter phyllosphaerae]TEW67898.1 NAD+ synthase [Mucilaginibacter phyllosphaerae]GGH15898.1 NAD+ synthase [Mucilaginibacter phyllosphaerae]
MKIALAQLNYHIGNFESNTQKIITSIREAKQNGADLVVFAELCVCGYPARDFLEFNEFISLCDAAAHQIAAACTGIACIIGLPTPNHNPEGKDLNNSAYFIDNGEIKAVVNKALLPNYDIFDEYRYFEPSTTFNCIDFKGKRIALTICEDLWNTIENPLYITRPMDTLIKQKPDVMINIAASPFAYNHDEERIAILSDNAGRYNLPLFYVNHVGAQTELIFDGGSLVFDKNGKIADELPYFSEAVTYYNLHDDGSISFEHQTTQKANRASDIEQIYQGLILGIQDYFYKSGFKQAILGLSGGIDSAVVCALAAEALGPQNVMAVLLPSKFSSDHSLKDAEDLVANLGCKSETIAIEKITDAFENSLHPQFQNLPFNIAEENIQSRSRAVLLMAMCNKFGYILLNTSNKSEAAVGYGTLYGDMCGGISVIGDVFKTQVFQLARYINRQREIIPENTIVKPPSAELRPDQKDTDSLPEYDILDAILVQYVERRCSSAEIIKQGFDNAVVHKVLRLVNLAEHKRYQTPPILRVSPKAFGMGRRMPIVGKYLM